MTGEQVRKRGLGVAAAGVVLVAWVVVFALTTVVGNPAALVAVSVAAGIVCACALAAGVVATRVTGTASAARLRHVFVVLEGAALAVCYPFYWFSFSAEPVEESGGLALAIVLVLAVPVFGSLACITLVSRGVHKVVADADGPLVPDSGDGAPAQRMRVLGTVLVTAGSVLAVAAVAVALTAARYQPIYLVAGLAVTLTPVVLGVVLTRVTDVYSARRRNTGPYIVIITAFSAPMATFGFDEGTVSVLLGATMFGAVVLVVVAILMLREYTGEWDRPWRERTWGRRVSR